MVIISAMRIVIATPVQIASTRGNSVTARRWQRLLFELGHEVRVLPSAEVHEDCDLLIALHARKSARVIEAFARNYPNRRIVLAMTGTDLYGDLPDDADARASVRIADQIVVLQPAGLARLPEEARGKAHVIRQSRPTRSATAGNRSSDAFSVCILAHLREVKDPLLAARAVVLLPADSKVHVTLAGAAPDSEWSDVAKREHDANPRFTWAGELSADAAADLLASSHVLVVSSLFEGGANVVTEAIVAGVPILATEIDGNIGMLGSDYQGYFPVGDTRALAALMQRAEVDAAFLAALSAQLETVHPLFEPAREREAWAELLLEL